MTNAITVNFPKNQPLHVNNLVLKKTTTHSWGEELNTPNTFTHLITYIGLLQLLQELLR